MSSLVMSLLLDAASALQSWRQMKMAYTDPAILAYHIQECVATIGLVLCFFCCVSLAIHTHTHEYLFYMVWKTIVNFDGQLIISK